MVTSQADTGQGWSSAEEAGPKHFKLFIDGRWQDAADGKEFDSYEPATGKVWAKVAEAGPPTSTRSVVWSGALGASE